jgi:hypothetical protein
MAVRWQIRCYLSPQGVDEVRAWYDKQPRKVQAKFLSRLKALAQQELSEWKPPLFRWLHGNCVPLGEIRFEVQRVQHRPLGFRGPGATVFTITFCTKEQSDRFVPANACSIALGHKAEIETHPEQSHVCWFPLE